ncbi:hypothetical protein M9Y10_023997 [Tritrichomonas musculus]|uniref:Pyridoxal-dependent decarboxylase n=1 Tax=Tritrichomonas musculus TaxID=1915356 RepID=A0ABR2KWQ8_9EUKA
MQNSNLLQKAYSVEGFKETADDILGLLMKLFPTEETAHKDKTIPFRPPEDQLKDWQNEFNSGPTTLKDLTEKIIANSLILSNKRNVAHQLSVTLPITMLTAAISARLNNVPTHYQLGMTAITMERIVIEHMLQKFGFNEGSTGTVVTGGSMGNLTALVTARTKYERFFQDKRQAHNLAIMVSEVAHYSIERAAMVMGLDRENIIQLPLNPDCTVKVDELENKLKEARSKGKIVFCIVGCASTTSHGAHDDLTALGTFAKKHNMWFHVDGAHGGCAAFSKKYKHLLKGIELCDSVIIDFHKMLMVPTTSTAILYNRRAPPPTSSDKTKTAPHRTTSTPSNSEVFRSDQPLKQIYSFTKEIDNQNDGDNSLVDFSAPYLFNDSQSNEWYEGGYHTLECSKPTVIFHTYAILRIYGDELFEQNVDTLYDMGIKFGQMVEKRPNFKLAVKPQNNIVCFRYVVDHILEKEKTDNENFLKEIAGLDEIEQAKRRKKHKNLHDVFTQNILDKIVNDGTYYLSSAPVFGILYLRVTFMNPFTDDAVLNEILDKVEEYAKLEESKF